MAQRNNLEMAYQILYAFTLRELGDHLRPYRVAGNLAQCVVIGNHLNHAARVQFPLGRNVGGLGKLRRVKRPKML